MISRILQSIEQGLLVMRSNSRLLLIAVLVFVFPILFFWITQNFFLTANSNVETAEKLRIGSMHDSIVSIMTSSPDFSKTIDALIEMYIEENKDVTKIRILDRDDEGFRIILSNNPDLLGTYESYDDSYKTLPFSEKNDSFIVKLVINGERTWQVFRRVQLPDNELYIFTEHNFSQIDSVMAARMQQSYYGLSAIFIFLIVLAYWIQRQESWFKQYEKATLQLKERDMFSSMIAHEFRSPLTAIKGYASFLEESKNLSLDEQRFAGNIHKSAQRLVVLVSDFLEVARLQAGKLKIKVTEVDIRNVLETVSTDLRSMAEKKGLGITYVKGDKPVLMKTDSSRMIQVITNIVSNAVKYTDKGTVELECDQTYDHVTIRIKDTGSGISADDQKKLFTPFTRVGGVDSGSTTGTGLGMWITQHLVILLGGTIGVESIEGIGTHIVLAFKV